MTTRTTATSPAISACAGPEPRHAAALCCSCSSFLFLLGCIALLVLLDSCWIRCPRVPSFLIPPFSRERRERTERVDPRHRVGRMLLGQLVNTLVSQPRQHANSIVSRPRQHATPPPRRCPAVCASEAQSDCVELQSDCGRGVAHLSYRLEEGDVCVYQVGTWQVDWSEVGSGAAPRLLLVRVDCLQLNWTHDHEHGLITATAINEVDGRLVRVDEDEPYAVAFAPE